MKKKQTANLIMVAIIVVIFLAGILCVGMIQGKFDEDDGSKAVLTNIRGIINMERDGVFLTLQEDTVLRAGDRLVNYPGATADVKIGNTLITFGDQAELEITEPDADSFCANALAGEFFINAEQEIRLVFEDKAVLFSQSVSHLSVRAGAQSVSVLEGSVDGASAGQVVNWYSNERSVSELSIQSLNAFLIEQIREANKSKTLCFSNQELEQVEAQRLTEKKAMLNAAKEATNPPVTITGESTEPEETEGDDETEETEPSATAPTEPEETEPPTTEREKTTEPTSKPTEREKTTEPTSKPTEREKTTEPTSKPTEPEKTAEPTIKPTEPTAKPTEPENTCTIQIVCDTILNNWDLLDPAKAGFVPGNGVILRAVTVEFEEGETVFDVLNRVCEAYEIQLEYSWTPLYDSYYIEGVNNLYEFDCGSESGWMYKVNGWFPNYGCSSYTVSDGDAIVWCYTCIGLGADVGGNNWS